MSDEETRFGGRIVDIQKFLNEFLGGDLHSKRIESLANATLGVMTSASLAVATIGQALAQARGLLTKHAVKQVDRLLSNQGVVVWDLFAYWVPQVIGERNAVVVAMDWTDFDADGQTTLALSLVTSHGRATPLLWLTVRKDELKESRNDFEDLCLMRLSEVLPQGVAVTILADRGFGDQKLFGYLDRLGFDYIIRIRGDIYVTDAAGKTRAAAEWIGAGGRAQKLSGAKVTAAQHQVGAVVCVHDKKMKEPWCLATSKATATAREIIGGYSNRWTIEPGFRDAKDLRFGMGLDTVRVGQPDKRDRLLLVNAFAIVLLTLLGAAGESLGMDRHLKVNTTKRRTHSLFRQGCMLYELIPNMPEVRLRPLIERFAELLLQFPAFQQTFAVV
jgi:Transposase DDE domain